MVFDQLFTAENFRRIYDSENRKGSDLAAQFFPALEPHTIAVRDKVKEIRELRKIEAALAVADFEAKLAAMKDELVALKTAKSAAIDLLMDEISQN